MCVLAHVQRSYGYISCEERESKIAFAIAPFQTSSSSSSTRTVGSCPTTRERERERGKKKKEKLLLGTAENCKKYRVQLLAAALHFRLTHTGCFRFFFHWRSSFPHVFAHRYTDDLSSSPGGKLLRGTGQAITSVTRFDSAPLDDATGTHEVSVMSAHTDFHRLFLHHLVAAVARLVPSVSSRRADTPTAAY